MFGLGSGGSGSGGSTAGTPDTAATSAESATAADDASTGTATTAEADATTDAAASDAATATTGQPQGQLVARFLDVGQGDAIVFEFPDGKTLVVDAGRDGAAKVNETLAADGRQGIDWLVATHPDADHIGGMSGVIQANDVRSVWAPYANSSTKTYTRFLEAVASKGLSIDAAYAGERIAEGEGYAIDVLWPPDGASYEDTNDYSVVLLVTFGQNTFLLAGDAPAEALERSVPGHMDVLKASHHGSASGTNVAVAQRTTPAIAILSYGLDNSYGHPAQSVIDALEGVGATIYGTGAMGTITVVSDGTHATTTTERQGTVVAASEDAGSSSQNL